MRPLARFAWLVLAFNLAVIVWGAYVRASGSGAGCGNHWPLCNGEVVPRAPSAQTLIEYSHRATSGLALIAVVALAIAVFRSRPAGDPTRFGAGASLLFMLSEAAVGAGLVLFRLVAENDSMARAMYLAAHLANTFFLLAALGLTAFWANGGSALRLHGRPALLWRFALAFAGLLVVGASGTVAALGDTLHPATTLEQALARNVSPTSQLLLRLRVLHPLLAALTGAYLLMLSLRLRREKVTAGVRSWSGRLALLVLGQVLLGLANVALLAPVWLQLLHLLLADLVWVAAVELAAQRLAFATPDTWRR